MLDNWNAVRVFVEVAKTGSMLNAAKTLGTTQPTVSRTIRELEAAVGEGLFIRHARGVRLTPRGQTLFASAEKVAEEMERLTRLAQDGAEVRGRVRIATTEIVGVEVLAPALATLRQRYPALNVELVLQNSLSSFTHGEADVALRLVRPQDPALVTQKIGQIPTGFYASREYLQRRGVPTDMDDALNNHDLIGFDPKGPVADLYSRFDERLRAERFQITSDSLTLHLMCARKGAGLATLQAPIAARYPELVQVLEDLPLPSLEVWLTTHEDLRGAARIRATMKWLRQVLEEYLLT